MKVLHTSDWHIGKQLHKVDLSEDIDLFFNWLIEFIEKEKIDVVLVSGDIFDQANPSQAAFKQYYDFLTRVVKTKCKLILTGGNHDSVSVLNAPRDLLNAFDITVIGGVPLEVKDLFIEVKKGDERIVVAAVPFLRDRDIRKSAPGQSYSDKIQQTKDGIQEYFKEINEHYENHFSGVPFFVMGHLYVQGSHLSESERDIQIGNQAGVKSDIFGANPCYIALGHIHKPQVVSASRNARYSGSPVAFSFSEKEDEKQVVLIELSEDIIVQEVKIPSFRRLVAFEGTMDEVEKKVESFRGNTDLHQQPLIALGEIIVHEATESLAVRQQLDELMESSQEGVIKLVKSRLHFSNVFKGASDHFESGTDVSDVTPLQMFEKKMDMELEGVANREELINAFKEILEKMQ